MTESEERRQVCPWCGSTDPAVRKTRLIDVRCASAWHSDHPEHDLLTAHFDRKENGRG